ncbi:MAG TPA: UdgX family uracil-DNA binding protein [Hyphomonadaceae bacterium]|nr:UdgX family uracil-DNA binding protein [Hyphomonadaceae bacterium]
MDPTAHQHIYLNGGADLQGFRQALRILTWSHIPHRQITWCASSEPELFGGGKLPSSYGAAGKPIILPRTVADLIRLVVCHSDPEKYALLYELVWRMRRPDSLETHLHEVASDKLVARLTAMAKSVRRDLHKMHAFVRFRQVNDPVVGPRFVAWFEPDHFIVEETAKFFIDRFTSIDWAILTPKGSLWWDKAELAIGPPGSRADAPETDAFELGWRTYYESTFNPARTNLNQMRQHMPKKYWRNLPETRAIPHLIQAAASRVDRMIEQEPAMPAKRNPAKAVAAMTGPGITSLAELNAIIAKTEPFVEGSPKAVFGEGPLHPAIAFVGEQPGDQEDLQGRPFVGPAGQLLDRALEHAGIDRSKAYITNAVKHFKFVRHGKRRIHESPTAGEIKHYRWWLKKELELVKPRLVVALGATAVHALEGKALTIQDNRGEHAFPAEYGRRGYITVHPSSLLRQPTAEDREREYAAFVRDLERVRDLAA